MSEREALIVIGPAPPLQLEQRPHCKWNSAQCNWGWTAPCALVCVRPREKKKEEKICSAVAAGWGNPVAAQTRPQRTAISTALSPLLPVVLIQRRAEVTAPLCCAPPGPGETAAGMHALPPSFCSPIPPCCYLSAGANLRWPS